MKSHKGSTTILLILDYTVTRILAISLTLFSWGVTASMGQIKLDQSERKQFEEFVDLYRFSNFGRQNPFLEKFIELKPKISPKFNSFLSQIIISQDKPENLLKEKNFKRPDHNDLVFWRLLKAFHLNNIEQDVLQKNSLTEIYLQILADTIDENELVKNYCNMAFSSNLAFLSNSTDLSNFSFNLDKLGYKNQTERAILYHCIISACGTRIRVMSVTGKGDPYSAIRRMPKINGNPYYEFTNFEFKNFNFISNKQSKSFKNHSLDEIYGILLSHLKFLMKKNKRNKVMYLYSNSILSKSEYYKYSNNKKVLQELNKKMSNSDDFLQQR